MGFIWTSKTWGTPDMFDRAKFGLAENVKF